MDIMAIAPVGIIGVAIAVTELAKQYIEKTIFYKIVWIFPLIVSIVGAILTVKGDVLTVIWSAIQYAAVSSYTVLIVKRLGEIKKDE